MAQVQLHVELLDFSTNALSIIYVACRQCYSAGFAGQIFVDGNKDPAKEEEFVRQVVSSGHESPLEHAKFTFAIEGVSRALTHQLVRHRVASYSQQSQRYVKESSFDYVIPPSIEADEGMKKEYISIMQEIQKSYSYFLSALEKKGKKGESANQDARFVLAQAAETKIIVTMNCRELMHFFKERCCSRAQWEIRRLADEMLKVCKQKLPAVFNNSGAKCVTLGYCPEGARFTCKRYPLKEEVLEGAKHAKIKESSCIIKKH
jgi:thymidylate synthase (FAD)